MTNQQKTELASLCRKGYTFETIQRIAYRATKQTIKNYMKAIKQPTDTTTPEQSE